MLPAQAHILGRVTAGFRKTMQGWLEVLSIQVLQQEAREFTAMVGEFVDIFKELEKPRHLRRRRNGRKRLFVEPAGLPVLDISLAPFEVSDSDEEEETGQDNERDEQYEPSVSHRSGGTINIDVAAQNENFDYGRSDGELLGLPLSLGGGGGQSRQLPPIGQHARTAISHRNKRRGPKSASHSLMLLVNAALDHFQQSEKNMLKLLLVEDSLNVEAVMRLRLQVIEHRAAMSLFIALSRKKQPSPTIVAGPDGSEITLRGARTGAGGVMLSKGGGALLMHGGGRRPNPPQWMINQAVAIPQRRFYSDIFTPLEVLDRCDVLVIRPAPSSKANSAAEHNHHTSVAGSGGGGTRKRRFGNDDLLETAEGSIASFDVSRLEAFQIHFDVTMRFYRSTVVGVPTNDADAQNAPPPPLPLNYDDSPDKKMLLRRLVKLPVSSTYIDLAALVPPPPSSTLSSTLVGSRPTPSTSLLEPRVLRQARLATNHLSFPANKSQPFLFLKAPPPPSATTTTTVAATTSASSLTATLTRQQQRSSSPPPLRPPLSSSSLNSLVKPLGSLNHNSNNNGQREDENSEIKPSSPHLSLLMLLRSNMLRLVRGQPVASAAGSSRAGRGIPAHMLIFGSDIWELYDCLIGAPVSSLQAIIGGDSVPSTSSRQDRPLQHHQPPLHPAGISEATFNSTAATTSNSNLTTQKDQVTEQLRGILHGSHLNVSLLYGLVASPLSVPPVTSSIVLGSGGALSPPLHAPERQWALISPSSTLAMQLVMLGVGGLFACAAHDRAHGARLRLYLHRYEVEAQKAGLGTSARGSRPGSAASKQKSEDVNHRSPLPLVRRPLSSSQRPPLLRSPSATTATTTSQQETGVPSSSLSALVHLPALLRGGLVPHDGSTSSSPHYSDVLTGIGGPRAQSAEPRASMPTSPHDISSRREAAATPPPPSSSLPPILRQQHPPRGPSSSAGHASSQHKEVRRGAEPSASVGEPTTRDHYREGTTLFRQRFNMKRHARPAKLPTLT